jgi:N-acetylglutamate synthase-like GNAT family acetyltransferase
MVAFLVYSAENGIAIALLIVFFKKNVSIRMKIRKATIKDRDKILSLLQKTPELQGSQNKIDAEYTAEYVSDCILDTQRNCVLIAVDNEKIIGLLTAEMYPKKGFSHLTDIVVTPTKRNQRVGSQLYQRCEKILKKKKISAIAGITQASNKIMQKFCAEHGLKMGKKMYYFEKIF